jgi:hypothetical protein
VGEQKNRTPLVGGDLDRLPGPFGEQPAAGRVVAPIDHLHQRPDPTRRPQDLCAATHDLQRRCRAGKHGRHTGSGGATQHQVTDVQRRGLPILHGSATLLHHRKGTRSQHRPRRHPGSAHHDAAVMMSPAPCRRHGGVVHLVVDRHQTIPELGQAVGDRLHLLARWHHHQQRPPGQEEGGRHRSYPPSGVRRIEPHHRAVSSARDHSDQRMFACLGHDRPGWAPGRRGQVGRRTPSQHHRDRGGVMTGRPAHHLGHGGSKTGACPETAASSFRPVVGACSSAVTYPATRRPPRGTRTMVPTDTRCSNRSGTA